MKFGLTKEQYSYLINTLKPIYNRGAKIWCYGSRARGDHNKFSDLDIMIESDMDLSSLIGAIKEEIANSNFPYKVDLTALNDFAQSYLKSFNKDKKVF